VEAAADRLATLALLLVWPKSGLSFSVM